MIESIYGEISSSNKGIIYSVALSPDEKCLAVAGIIGDNKNTGGRIKIYDFSTRNLITFLTGHTGSVKTLSPLRKDVFRHCE